MPKQYKPLIINALRESLSPARFDQYVNYADGDRNLAIDHYLLNARLSEACLFPLGVAEVVLRNAIDEAITKDYTETWPENSDFIRLLNSGSCRALESAKRKVSHLGYEPTRDRVVSILPLDFWSNLMRLSEYNDSGTTRTFRGYEEFWGARLTTTFPNLPPHGSQQARIARYTHAITDFRNRIAHHEPIYRNPRLIWKNYSKMVELTGFRCRITARWMKKRATVAHFLNPENPTHPLRLG